MARSRYGLPPRGKSLRPGLQGLYDSGSTFADEAGATIEAVPSPRGR